MNRKKSLVGIGLIAALMALTGWLLFRDQPVTRLLHTLGQLRPGWLLLGLALMLAFVGCEATCSHLILGRLGHRAPLRRCLGYSFVGFYVSSITPSATGGQPAQIYYMSRDGVPAAHGDLNMMLIAVCYQVVVIGYALAVALLRFDLVANLGGGLGLLPKRMAAWAEKAFYGTCDKYLSKNPDGSLQLDGICLVAGLGGKDHRDGSLAYYFSEPVVCNDAKGVGPLVLAYTEMIARK